MINNIDRILHDFLVESQENLERLDHEFIILEKQPDNRELLTDIFRIIHGIKGSAGFLKLPRLEALAHAAEDVLAKARNGDIAVSEQMMTCALHAVDCIRTMLLSLESTGLEGGSEYSPIILHLQALAAGQYPPVGSEPTCLAHTFANAEKPPSEQKKFVPAESEPLNAIQTEEHPVDLSLKGNYLETSATTVEDMRIHVDVAVLDRLLNLTGELVLSRNQIARLAQESGISAWQTAAQHLNSVVTELQGSMLKARMQELRKVFGLFPRLVHDLAKQFGKEVALHIEGQQIELDRTVIAELKMPLIHLVRNAIDHGIETPENRQRQGKPRSGTITIRAYHESGQVNIAITDDGAGIDPEHVKDKALALGLLTREQMAHVSNDTLLDMICQPGFSTAETVTNLSGRGVGMDVVKRQIDRIGGVMEMVTTQGQGVTFTLRIPMTLAIITGLVVAAQDRQFVIPQRNLEELVRLDRDAERIIMPLAGAEVYRLRGELLPVIRLNAALQLSSQTTDSSFAAGKGSESADCSDLAPRPLSEGELVAVGQNSHIVVLAAGERRFGLLVDHVRDTEEIVVKPLGRHIKQAACYDGATILGDGQVALILNARGMLAAGRLNLDDLQRAELTDRQRRSADLNKTTKEHRQTIVLCKAGPEELYGVPLAFVKRIERFAAAQIETSGGQEVLSYRNTVLPLMRLESLLHLAAPPVRSELSLLVFSVEQPIGLVVQEVINTIEINAQLETGGSQRKGVLGSTLVEGHATLILDIHGLIELAYPDWYQRFFISKLSAETRQQTLVLLVEDSKFFLNIEKSYLESAGYQVITAEHGNAALERLAEQPVDVVVTDIDMPYCNGYELTKAIKARAEWKHIPVMAVTALSSAEDRQKGIAAGVDEYRIKLNRDDVLNALEQLLLKKAAPAI